MKKIILFSLLFASLGTEAVTLQDISDWASQQYTRARKGVKSGYKYLKGLVVAPKEKSIDVQLKQAVKKGDLETVNKLLADGVNPNIPDRFRATALHYATNTGSLEIMKALINAGANVNARDYFGNTPLHAAKTINSAKLLIENGADLSIKSGNSHKTGEEHALSLKDARGNESTVLAEIIKRTKANKPSLKDEL